MADHLSRAFTFQLTSAMERAVRTVVFEITQIFENSLHDHRMELVQKGEEVAHLKIQLQEVELKLKEMSGDGKVEMSKTQTCEIKKESEESQIGPEQPSVIPEIDVGVQDWCVPLGFENEISQDNFCPSVRLRQFSIPLWPISVKHEQAYNIEEPGPESDGKPQTVLDETSGKTMDKSLPKIVRRSQRTPVNNKPKNNLMNQKKMKYSDKLKKTLTGEEQNNSKVKTSQANTVNNATGITYPCKFCSKVFDTFLGRTVHIMSHRKCKGCKQVFPYPSTLLQHKTKCAKYKLMAVNCSNLTPARSAKENPPRMHKESIKTKPLETEGSHIKRKESKGNKKLESVAKKCKVGFKCLKCNHVCKSKYAIIDHANIHTGEKPYKCGYCPGKFTHKSYLCYHKRVKHNMHERPYTCTCGRSFAKKASYKDHKLNCKHVKDT